MSAVKISLGHDHRRPHPLRGRRMAGSPSSSRFTSSRRPRQNGHTADRWGYRGGDAVGLDDITRKAQDFLADSTVKEALDSQQAEDISDRLLDGVADAASRVSGGKFDEQIDGAKKAADGAVGTEK